MNLASLITANFRVLLVAGPGCGKTARILAAAKATGREVIGYCAGTAERVDLAGGMVPDLDNSVMRQLPLEKLHTVINTTKPTILFLDDIGNGELDVQAALKSQLTRGGDIRRNPNVLIWGATNRPGDKTGVRAIHESLRSEFDMAFTIPKPGSTAESSDLGVLLCDWRQELDSWCDWAIESEADPAVIAWHRATTGRTLYAWSPNADPSIRMPDYRSWETVIRLRKAGFKDLQSTAAAIGKPTASEFLAFERLADDLPTPDEIRDNPKKAKVPDDANGQFLIVSMLTAAATKKDANAFIIYLGRLPRAMGALLARGMHKRLGEGMSRTPEWAKWFEKNEEIFK